MSAAARVSEYLQTADLLRVRADDAAAHLCMTPTTMRRRLVADGTRYSDLLEIERKRRVAELLARNPHADTWRIADTAGLGHRNNVTREFRRWFGVSVRQLKAYRRAIA